MTVDRPTPSARPAASPDRPAPASSAAAGGFAALLDAQAPAPARPEQRPHERRPAGEQPHRGADAQTPAEPGRPVVQEPVDAHAPVPTGTPVAPDAIVPLPVLEAAVALPTPVANPAAPVAAAAVPVAAAPAPTVPAAEAQPATAPAIPAASAPATPAPLPTVPAEAQAATPAEGQPPVPAAPAVPAPATPAAATTAPAQPEAAAVQAAAEAAPAPTTLESAPADAAPSQHKPAEPAQSPPVPVQATAPEAVAASASEPVAPTGTPLSGHVAPHRAAPLHHAPQAVATLLHVAAERGITRAHIALRPADLGGIEIRLQQTAAGVAAQVVADSPEAARLLAQAGEDLRRSLEARDVTLISLEVSTSGEQRRDAPGGRDGAEGFDGPTRASHGGGEPEEAAAAEVPTQTVIELPGGLLVDVLA
jgi:flagellar hook-length control protein FliK